MTTSGMTKVATVGAHDHMENMAGSEEIPRNLTSKAATTARHSARTAKMVALVASVSFVNLTPLLFPRRFFGEACGRRDLSSPSLSWLLVEPYGAEGVGIPVELPGRATGSGYRIFCPAEAPGDDRSAPWAVVYHGRAAKGLTPRGRRAPACV